MDITLDIGAAVLGVAVPLIAFWFNDERKKKEAKAEAKEKARREAEEIRENERRDAEDLKEQDRVEKDRRYRDLKEAVEIHASLTDLPVAKALKDFGPIDKEFLGALHERSTTRFEALSSDFPLNDEVTDLVYSALTKIHKRLPTETKASQDRADRKKTQNHEKNDWVQTRVVDFAESLQGKPVFAGVEVSKKRQSVHLVFPNGTDSIWFAGNNKGEIPSEIKHRERDAGVETGKWRDKDKDKESCKLGSAATGMKGRLKKKNTSGKELAEAFMEELQKLADTGTGKCTCGVPYLPSRSKALPATE